MKITTNKTAPTKLVPTTISIIMETKEDMITLWKTFNMPRFAVKDHSSSRFEGVEFINTISIWETLDELVEEYNLKYLK